MKGILINNVSASTANSHLTSHSNSHIKSHKDHIVYSGLRFSFGQQQADARRLTPNTSYTKSASEHTGVIFLRNKKLKMWRRFE